MLAQQPRPQRHLSVFFLIFDSAHKVSLNSEPGIVQISTRCRISNDMHFVVLSEIAFEQCTGECWRAFMHYHILHNHHESKGNKMDDNEKKTNNSPPGNIVVRLAIWPAVIR